MTIKLEDKKSEIARIRNWGVGLVASLFGLKIWISELLRIWPPKIDDYPYLILFITCGILVFIWIWATQKELDMLFLWLDPERYSPPSGFKETATMVGLSLLLVLLMMSSKDPLLFGSIFTAYNITVLFAVIALNKQVKEAIEKTKERYIGKGTTLNELSEEATIIKAVIVVEQYFINRPHTKRHIVILISGCLGLFFAALAQFYELKAYQVGAFVIYIVTIIFSEVWIGHWRNIRDNDLRPIEADMREHLRKKEKLKLMES